MSDGFRSSAEERCFRCPNKKPERNRYGKSWCADCLSQIRFEERLANASGLVVTDVILRQGHLTVVFGVPPGRIMSMAELDANVSQIRISKSEVLEMLGDAMAGLRAEMSDMDRRFAVVGDGARRKAQRLVELAEVYLSLLDGNERDAFENCVALARRIARQVSPAGRSPS